jgi:hypothetical protein
MLYIANIKLSESFHQSFTTKSKEAHIIEAETLDEAKDKLYKFYLNKDIEHYISYDYQIVSINEIII